MCETYRNVVSKYGGFGILLHVEQQHISKVKDRSGP